MRNIHQEIDNLVQNHSIVLFMKGNFHFPQCKFSAKAIEILKDNGLKAHEVKTINVLDDELMRQGIKDYSHWPTIPQLYLNGEFIGGSDIMIEMHEDGELRLLVEEIQKINV